MNIWIRELTEITHFLLGQPKSQVEFGVLFILAIAGLLLAMYMVGSATRIPNLGTLRRALALVVGVGCLMCVWVAVQTHVLPHVEVPWARLAVEIGIPVVAMLLIVVPVQQVILRSSYASTLITFVVSIALTALILVLAHFAMGAIETGQRDSGVIKRRTESVDSLIDR